MVEQLLAKYRVSLLDYLKTKADDGFYITEDNKRFIVDNEILLKKLLSKSTTVLIRNDRDVEGIILVWKSLGNNLPRYHVKISANNENVARDLLTALLWSEFRQLYIKLKKTSPFIRIFKEKGFVFIGDRGKEILLSLNNTFRKKYVNNQHNIKDSSDFE